MKNDINEFLNTHTPVLRNAERNAMWKHIDASMETLPTPSPYVEWFRLHTRVAVGVLMLALVVTGSATSVFAGEARPGDTLFGLDRALERIELALTRTPEARTNVGLAHAEERILELRELIHEHGAPTSTPATTQHHVGAAVDALVNVLEESQMNDTARERIYENLFEEIDPLSVDVHVDRRSEKSSTARVTVGDETEGKTKIEITDTDKRTRIEKKNGHVHIEYNVGGEVRGVNAVDEQSRGQSSEGGRAKKE